VGCKTSANSFLGDGVGTGGSIAPSNKLSLIRSVLDDLAQLCEVVVVIDSKKELGEVWRALMVVLEVAEELEHLVGLPLEVDLQSPELSLKRRILHLLLINASEQSAQLAAHV